MKKISLLLLVFLFAVGTLSPSALAQPIPFSDEPPELLTPNLSDSNEPPEIYGGRLFNESDRYRLTGEGGIITSLLPRVATWMTGLLAAVAVLFLMYAGILFLTAGGEEEKISEATKTAVYVVLGLILAMFGYVLVYLFLTLFNPA
jgi:hypothetical protein